MAAARTRPTPAPTTAATPPTVDPVGARPTRRATPLELTFLPGLGDVLADEAAEVLLLDGPPDAGPGPRRRARGVAIWSPLADVRDLRTAVAAFLVLHFDVPRPKSLTSGDHLARIVDAMYASLRVGRLVDASGSRPPAATRRSSRGSRRCSPRPPGLRYDDRDGELVVRVRRGVRPGRPATPAGTCWSALGSRPLSARRWRVTDYPGAVERDDRRRHGPARRRRPRRPRRSTSCAAPAPCWSSACSPDPRPTPSAWTCRADALTASSENLTAATLGRRRPPAARRLHRPRPVEAVGAGYDLLLADPPWGTLHGTHATNAEVHAGMLRAAYDAAAPGARFVVLTHEIKVMERCLRDADALWRVRSETRVFAKGHHPRIYVLDRT